MVRDDVSIEGAQVQRATLADPAAIARAAEGCTHLIHAAGEASDHASPDALGWINVAGTENVVRAARHLGIERLVFLSCADVTLHAKPRMGWSEDRVLTRRPLGAHARTMLAAEETVIGSGGPHPKGTLETIALRPGWLWGAGDTSRLPGLCREALAGGFDLAGPGTNLVATAHVDNLAHAAVRALDAEDAAGAILHVLDAEIALARDFYGDLCEAVGLPAPRPGRLGAASRLRLGRGVGALGAPAIARRGLSASLDGRRAKELLDYQPPVAMHEGMAALKVWAKEVGGAEAIAAMARPPATDESVAEQRRAAGAGA